MRVELVPGILVPQILSELVLDFYCTTVPALCYVEAVTGAVVVLYSW